MPDILVGLDIGGTTIKGGAITGAGETVAQGDCPFDPEAPAADILDRAARLARELGVEGGLGVGCAGVFDRATGALVRSANMPNLEGQVLEASLAERLELPRSAVRQGNDANLAALGELWLGAGRYVDDLVMITLGTGVGGGIVMGGALVEGPGGMAGEIGHVVVRSRGAARADDPKLECNCGSYGCLERLASATAVQERARLLGLTDDLPALADEARAGAGAARDLMHAVGRDLGHGLAYSVTLLDIPTFVIGGGFGAALDVLRPGIRQGLEERRYGNAEARVLGAELGSRAGWIGAARLVRDR